MTINSSQDCFVLTRGPSGKADCSMADYSPATNLFRQLFSRCRCTHGVCSPASIRSYHHRTAFTANQIVRSRGQTAFHARSEQSELDISSTRLSRYSGSYSKSRKEHENKVGLAWRQRTDVLPPDRRSEFETYSTATSDELSTRKRRPKRTKMLMRDFIEDSLYNQTYGYFSNQAVIFTPGEPFDFNSMRDEAEFYRVLGERYTSFEDQLDEQQPNDTRQLWHTPTELFRPSYAEATARYMVSNYKISNYPYHDLIIYEMGAGNGTFMLNVLDYIRRTDPDVYDRTQYRIIEISTSLANMQSNTLKQSAAAHDHLDKVEIINQSIFSWDTYVSSPCFFLALEVIDNFAHDIIRCNPTTEQPLQGNVLIDNDGEFFQFYSPDLDPVASRYLRVRDAATSDVPLSHPLRWSKWRRSVRSRLPFAPNLSDPEWIPTRCMMFFDVLQKYFPGHRLLLTDFSSLPNAIEGENAPVVQTRHQRRTVTVTTPLVHQGYFDILFPTDFHVMENMYRAITGRFTRVLSHEEFMRRWAYVEETECQSGENPLLSWYQNAAFMVTI